MPVLTDIGIRLTVDDVVTSWGPRRARLASKRMTDLVSNLLVQIDTEDWIQPKISFAILPVDSAGPGWLELRGGSLITSRTLGHHLPGAVYVAAGVCTIGNRLERRVSEWFAAGDRLRAVILDDIGTLALFRLGDQLENVMHLEAARLGLEAGGVLNPGEDGLEISQQATVLELANGASVDISRTDTGMLVPRKSISMLVGFGVRMPKWSRGERCAVCAARDRCPHRQSQRAEVSA